MTDRAGGTAPTGVPGEHITPWMRTGYVWTMAVSRLGTSIAGIATAFVVYDHSRSVLMTAVVTIASGIPVLLLAPWATTTVQRFGAARTFVYAGAVLAALGLVPAILSATGELDTLTLFLWQLAGGVVVGMSGPSNSLLARRLAPPGQVTGFNARLSRSGAVAIIVGLLVGGALVSAVGPTWAYLADVVSYLPAVLLIGACIKRLPTPVHPRHRFREGIQAVEKTGGLRAAFVTAGLLYLLATPVISTFPALAKQIDDGANALAMLMAAYAAGGLFVATVVRLLHRRESWALLGRRALFVSGFGLVALGLAVGLGGGAGVVLAISLVALLPTGLAVAIEFTMLSSLVELGAPEDQRSPVLTAYGTLSSVIGPIGGLAIGALADTVSVSFAVVTSGILLVLAGALTRILRFFRSLDDLDHPDAAEYAAAAPRPPTHPHLSFDHAVHHHRIPVDG